MGLKRKKETIDDAAATPTTPHVVAHSVISSVSGTVQPTELCTGPIIKSSQLRAKITLSMQQQSVFSVADDVASTSTGQRDGADDK
jgi:hypothetical protein